MENINIPIYRAQKIDSDEYVEGNIIEDEAIFYIIKNPVVTHFHGLQRLTGESEYLYRIDITTLSIHFPNMLDSQGNKIFASLNEDGKGGDIIKYEQVLGGILKSVGPEECIIKYCNRDHIIAPFFINAKYKNQKTYMTKEHLLIIGIQK